MCCHGCAYSLGTKLDRNTRSFLLLSPQEAFWVWVSALALIAHVREVPKDLMGRQRLPWRTPRFCIMPECAMYVSRKKTEHNINGHFP
jgi:hypothetical protein